MTQLFHKADPYHAPDGRFDFAPGGPQNQPTGRPRGRPPGSGAGGEGPHQYFSAAGRINSAQQTPDAQRTLFRASGGLVGGAAAEYAQRIAMQRFNAAAGEAVGGFAGRALGGLAGSVLGPAGTVAGQWLGSRVGGFIGANAAPYAAQLAGDYVGSKIGGALWALKNQITGARLNEQSINTRAHVSGLQAGAEFTPRDIAGEVGAHIAGGAGWGAGALATHLLGPGAGAAVRVAAEEVPGLVGDLVGYHAGISHYDAVHGGHAGPSGGGKGHSNARVKKLFPGGVPQRGGDMPGSPQQPAQPGAVPDAAGGGAQHGAGGGPPLAVPEPEPPKVPRLFKHPLVDAHPGFDGSVGSLKRSAPAALFGRKEWSEVKGTPFGHYLQRQVDDIADTLDEAQQQQVLGPHLLAKNFGFREANDMNGRLVNSGEGVPANIKFLRQLQAIDGKNRRAQVRRIGSQAELANLQPRVSESEDQYQARVDHLFRRNSDSAAVVKVSRRKAAAPVEKGFKIEAEIAKGLNPDDQLKQGLVYGWASVIEKDGVPVVDHQGDRISQQELVKAAHDFMKRRDGGVMHDETGHNIGSIVESVVLTKDLQKALGVDLGKVGWLIGYQISDARVKAMAQKRLLKAFSIGGRGRRRPAHA